MTQLLSASFQNKLQQLLHTWEKIFTPFVERARFFSTLKASSSISLGTLSMLSSELASSQKAAALIKPNEQKKKAQILAKEQALLIKKTRQAKGKLDRVPKADNEIKSFILQLFTHSSVAQCQQDTDIVRTLDDIPLSGCC